MILVFIIVFILLSLMIASYGSDREIGFGMALLLCLIASPVIGLIVVAFSEKELKQSDGRLNQVVSIKVSRASISEIEKKINKDDRMLTVLIATILVSLIVSIIYVLVS